MRGPNDNPNAECGPVPNPPWELAVGAGGRGGRKRWEGVPRGRESAFFGIYAISERGTSWLGPIVFGLVAQLTNSYRPAILALIVFFVVGSLILLFTNTAKAIEDAANEPAENEAAD